ESYTLSLHDALPIYRKGNNAFDGRSMIKETLDSIDRGLKVLNDLEVGPPFLVSFSFHNVLGNYLENDRSAFSRAFKQNELIFPRSEEHTSELQSREK